MKKHHEVVCAVIEKNGKIFTCQRNSYGECAYKWEFPGGKIKPGETHEEALIREVKEELNCIIKVNKYITTIEHEYNTFSLTLHVYLCSLVDNDPQISEHIDYKWCDKEELKMLDFAEADYKFLDKIKKIIDAQKDIQELETSLNDVNYFHNFADDIYKRVYSNIDYIPYINKMKSKLKMHGNNQFKILEYRYKRDVFKMFIKSIYLYIVKEINDTK